MHTKAKKNKRYVSGNMGRKSRVGRSDIYFILFYFFNMKVLAILHVNPKNDQKKCKNMKFSSKLPKKT